MRWVAGNWKMHMGVRESVRYFLDPAWKERPDGVTISVHPPFPLLWVTREPAQKQGILLGAQNAFGEPEGPFTGEVSARLLREMRVEVVIIGHSERRIHFHEDNALIARRLEGVLQEGLYAILCVGERREERAQGRTEQVLRQQWEVTAGLPRERAERLLVAYEPVWALGTGEHCEPEEANRVARLLKAWAEERWGMAVPVLYGGSVKSANAGAFAEMEDIQGVLVGGASLNPKEFVCIAQAFAEVPS